MEQRKYIITVEYLPERQLWRARARGFLRTEALGATEAEAVATLRTLLDQEIAQVHERLAPLLTVDAVSGTAYLRVPGYCFPNDVPGYSLDEALAAVGPGWATLVSIAHRRLTDVGGRIFQVKEKFGGLRIYFSDPRTDDGMQGAIRTSQVLRRWERWIELKSRSTCEACGAVGEEVKRYGWMRTLCASCDWRWQEGAWTWAEIRGDLDLDRGTPDDG